LLHAQGDLAGARPLFERALAIHEKALAPEHPTTATTLNNFGRLLHARGDLAGARPLFERALAICEKALGPEHPLTATTLGNLASLLHAQGDLAGARPLFERALANREKALGPEHPLTATTRHIDDYVRVERLIALIDSTCAIAFVLMGSLCSTAPIRIASLRHFELTDGVET
jgi:Tfp pilus assembly protein PilF